jgi:hypothetical protein
MPTDGPLAGLERSIRGTAGEDATQKLKELLGCVVDEVVVESRERITPYHSLPGVRPLFPQRRRMEQRSHHKAPGQALWVSVRDWGRARL